MDLVTTPKWKWLNWILAGWRAGSRSTLTSTKLETWLVWQTLDGSSSTNTSQIWVEPSTLMLTQQSWGTLGNFGTDYLPQTNYFLLFLGMWVIIMWCKEWCSIALAVDLTETAPLISTGMLHLMAMYLTRKWNTSFRKGTSYINTQSHVCTHHYSYTCISNSSQIWIHFPRFRPHIQRRSVRDKLWPLEEEAHTQRSPVLDVRGQSKPPVLVLRYSTPGLFTLQQARRPLWDFGTQPIMLLVSYRQWEELGHEWNVEGEMVMWLSNKDQSMANVKLRPRMEERNRSWCYEFCKTAALEWKG